jgi:ferredoxin-NADP reductase
MSPSVRRFVCAFAFAGLLMWWLPHRSAADEHASHHGGGSSGGMGGEMGGIGGEMRGEHGRSNAPFYPSLMNLPSLTPEQRAQIDQTAQSRMDDGTALMSKGVDLLSNSNDYAAMREGTRLIREGLDELQSGLAARESLEEQTPPQAVAFKWFRNQLNLPVFGKAGESQSRFGLSLFHLFTMGLLIVFAFAMLALYFAKMRRAAALFGRLEPDQKSPPPGSSPPLVGGPGPAAPPGGKPPPSSGAPSAPATLVTDAAVDADKPPAGASSAPASAGPVPLTAKWRGQLRVGSIVNETPLIKTFRLLRAQGDGPLPFTFRPGQFLNVAFGIGGARMNRSYSISSSPNERDFIELTIKREERGAVSRHIHDLIKVGDTILAAGPVGKFVFDGAGEDSIVLIAAGVGITPLMSIMCYLTQRAWAGDIYFIYGCRTEADFVFAKRLAELERRNAKLHMAVTMSNAGPDWKGAHGRISKELLAKTVPNLASRLVHLCGPPAMMDATKALLAEFGVPADRVKTETFGALKPPLGAPGTYAKPTSAATGPLVTFSKNNKSAKIRVDQTILELSEELAIGIEFSCRVGTCGVCKVHMTVGEVDMAVQDALDDNDKENGIILACQAKPKTEVTVEA